MQVGSQVHEVTRVDPQMAVGSVTHVLILAGQLKGLECTRDTPVQVIIPPAHPALAALIAAAGGPAPVATAASGTPAPAAPAAQEEAPPPGQSQAELFAVDPREAALQALFSRQRKTLEQAARDPQRVRGACGSAIAEWNRPGNRWPEDLGPWRRALRAAGVDGELEDLAPLPPHGLHERPAAAVPPPGPGPSAVTASRPARRRARRRQPAGGQLARPRSPARKARPATGRLPSRMLRPARPATVPGDPPGAAEVRAGLRALIGDSLPGWVGAMSGPASLRDFARRAAGSGPGPVAFRAGPDAGPGLQAAITSDGVTITTAPPSGPPRIIGWEELPAWTAGALPDGLAGELAAAAAAVARLAQAAPGHKGTAPPGDQEATQARGRLATALGEAWEAIMAAPAPGQPAQRPQPATAPGAAGQDGSPDSRPDRLASRPGPVTGTDLVIALNQAVTPQELSRLIRDGTAPPEGGSLGARRPGDPDAGASQKIDRDRTGITITIQGPAASRSGTPPWSRVRAWLSPVVPRHGWSCWPPPAAPTPGTTSSPCPTASAAQPATRPCRPPPARPTASPVTRLAASRPQPSPCTAPGRCHPGPGRCAAPVAGDDLLGDADHGTRAALDRIAQLESVLPAWPPRWAKPLSQVQPGDTVMLSDGPVTVTSPPSASGQGNGITVINGILPGLPQPAAGRTTTTGTLTRTSASTRPAGPYRPGPGPALADAGQPATAGGGASTSTAPAPSGGNRPQAPSAEPGGGGQVQFMNSTDIEEAQARWADHLVLGPATRTLAGLQAWADQVSDGWAHWQAPVQAASRLIALIEGGPAGATPAALKQAYTPLRTFRTQQKALLTRADFTIEQPATPAGSSRGARDARRSPGGKASPAAAQATGGDPLTVPGLAGGARPGAAGAARQPRPGLHRGRTGGQAAGRTGTRPQRRAGRGRRVRAHRGARLALAVVDCPADWQSELEEALNRASPGTEWVSLEELMDIIPEPGGRRQAPPSRTSAAAGGPVSPVPARQQASRRQGRQPGQDAAAEGRQRTRPARPWRTCSPPSTRARQPACCSPWPQRRAPRRLRTADGFHVIALGAAGTTARHGTLHVSEDGGDIVQARLTSSPARRRFTAAWQPPPRPCWPGPARTRARPPRPTTAPRRPPAWRQPAAARMPLPRGPASRGRRAPPRPQALDRQARPARAPPATRKPIRPPAPRPARQGRPPLPGSRYPWTTTRPRSGPTTPRGRPWTLPGPQTPPAPPRQRPRPDPPPRPEARPPRSPRPGRTRRMPRRTRRTTVPRPRATQWATARSPTGRPTTSCPARWRSRPSTGARPPPRH